MVINMCVCVCVCVQLGALHEVLEKLQTKRINPWEKKYGQVPSVSHTHTHTQTFALWSNEDVDIIIIIILQIITQLTVW